jgi:hypothetical protein
MGDRRAIALAFAALTFAACGGDDDSAAETTEATTTRASTTTTLIPTTTIAVTTTTDSVTTTASPPETTLPDTKPLTKAEQVAELAQQQLAELSDSDVASVGGIECATELSLVIAAGTSFAEETGHDPTELNDLYDGGFLVEPLELYVADESFMRPALGSGCADVFAPGACQTEAEDLIEARLAYFELNPGATEPSQDELVAAGVLDESSSIVDFVDGTVVAVSGGRCDGVDLSIDWRYPCRAAHKTLEVAQEAYRAMNGAETNPTETDLAVDFLRHLSGLYDIVDGAIVPAPNGPCVGLDLDF